MPFLVAIADLTHPLQNNRSSIGMIGCYQLVEETVPPRRGTVGVGHASRSCVYGVAVQSVYVLLLL